jgi:hypothetical protein
VKELLVPISPGELLDKITILRIKARQIRDATKLANVRTELVLLEQTWQDAVPAGSEAARSVAGDEAALQKVNESLWDIEDRIRDKELAQQFDSDFVALARAVYVTNDERAALKRRINVMLGSRIVEEKSYQPYR